MQSSPGSGLDGIWLKISAPRLSLVLLRMLVDPKVSSRRFKRRGSGASERVNCKRRQMAFCTFFGGEVYKGHFECGMYICSKCGHELFSSRAKYDHSSPWPAFTETIHPDSVSKRKEGNNALKISCGKCGNGLGHEFLNDGPKQGQSRF